MQTPNHILAVIDPTRDAHPALDRILEASTEDRPITSRVTILIAVDDENVDTRASNQLMHVSGNKLFEIEQRLLKNHIQHKVVLSWSQEWSKTIESVAKSNECDLIALPFYADQARGRYLLNNETWSLLRSSAIPITLSRHGVSSEGKILLAAMRLNDSRYDELNRKVYALSKLLEEHYNAELHVVAAYSDSMDYPDRGRFLNLTSLPNANVHIRQGAPEDVIAEVANRIKADTVIIGNQRRTGFKAALRGNTVERIVGQVVNSDVLMVL